MALVSALTTGALCSSMTSPYFSNIAASSDSPEQAAATKAEAMKSRRSLAR